MLSIPGKGLTPNWPLDFYLLALKTKYGALQSTPITASVNEGERGWGDQVGRRTISPCRVKGVEPECKGRQGL